MIFIVSPTLEDQREMHFFFFIELKCVAESSNGNNPMFCNMNMIYFSLFAVLLV